MECGKLSMLWKAKGMFFLILLWQLQIWCGGTLKNVISLVSILKCMLLHLGSTCLSLWTQGCVHTVRKQSPMLTVTRFTPIYFEQGGCFVGLWFMSWVLPSQNELTMADPLLVLRQKGKEEWHKAKHYVSLHFRVTFYNPLIQAICWQTHLCLQITSTKPFAECYQQRENTHHVSQWYENL